MESVSKASEAFNAVQARPPSLPEKNRTVAILRPPMRLSGLILRKDSSDLSKLKSRGLSGFDRLLQNSIQEYQQRRVVLEPNDEVSEMPANLTRVMSRTPLHEYIACGPGELPDGVKPFQSDLVPYREREGGLLAMFNADKASQGVPEDRSQMG